QLLWLVADADELQGRAVVSLEREFVRNLARDGRNRGASLPASVGRRALVARSARERGRAGQFDGCSAAGARFDFADDLVRPGRLGTNGVVDRLGSGRAFFAGRAFF